MSPDELLPVPIGGNVFYGSYQQQGVPSQPSPGYVR